MEAFQKLATSIPVGGLAVINFSVPLHIAEIFKCHTVSYGKEKEFDYYYKNIKTNNTGSTFDIYHDNKKYNIKTPMLGSYMAENITGCFALTNSIGIESEKIIESISSFTGIKRRLEKKSEKIITIFDDIAHSPDKARSALDTLAEAYKNSKIYAIFEPNSGNRTVQSTEGYAHAFDKADTVIIPRLTKIKIDSTKSEKSFDGKQLADIISRTHKNTTYIEDDDKLIDFIKTKTQRGDIVVFLGSHGFRSMIDKAISLHR